MTVDRRGVSGCVHEYPSVPLLAGELDETVGRHIEGGGIEARRHPKGSVELVGPSVVWADDDRAVDRRLTAREEFVTTVPAGVRKSTEHQILVAHQEHTGSPDRNGALIGGCGDVLGTPYADPSAFEKISLLPREDGVADV